MAINNTFLKPGNDGDYHMQQSQVIRGLWTPYGVVSPIFIGAWPDGSITITYNMHPGTSFKKSQQQKLKYIKKRGVEVTIMHEVADA